MTEGTEVRWLSAREQEAWRAYMTAYLELHAHLDRQLRTDAGMPVAYYEILVILSESPGRSLRMSRLAEVANSSRSRLSHAIASLEKNGWVSRCGTADDRRGSVARLTAAGLAALEAAAPGHVEEVRSCVLDPLTPEQVDALLEISRAIGARVRQRGRAPASGD